MAYSVGVQRRQGRWQLSKRGLFYLVLILYSIVTAIPYLWGIVSSFKSLPETARTIPTGLPVHPTLDAWNGAYGVFTASSVGGGQFPRWFLNSLIVAALVTIGNLFFASLAGYSFARLRFPGRNLLFLTVLGTLMVPDAMRIIPVYVLLVKMPLGSWINTYQGLSVPFMVTAFGIFLMRQFFLALPSELEDAARVDGLSRFGIYWRIALPLAKPPLAALAVLQFQGNWDSFIMPSFIAQTPNLYTLPVGLKTFAFSNYQGGALWPQLMAGSMVVILPILFIYIFVQRYFIEGVASTGIKG